MQQNQPQHQPELFYFVRGLELAPTTKAQSLQTTPRSTAILHESLPSLRYLGLGLGGQERRHLLGLRFLR